LAQAKADRLVRHQPNRVLVTDESFLFNGSHNPPVAQQHRRRVMFRPAEVAM
jgi:hypothetical protein